MSTKYVLGFMFSLDKRQVVLIKKKRPEWQAGLLNGIGGHLEKSDHSNTQAMIREFKEETGLLHTDWYLYAHMVEPGAFSIYIYYAIGDVYKVTSTTDEKVIVKNITDLPYNKVVENLYWLIPLALDCMEDGRPNYVSISYPQND